MIQKTSTVGEPVYGYFTVATASMEFLTGWEVYKDGVKIEGGFSITAERDGPNDYFTLKFIPATTGNYFVVMFDMEMHVEVVTKSLYSMVRNIEDEALGSWTWNKTSGELSLLKQDGSALASFDIVDTQTLASRERTS